MAVTPDIANSLKKLDLDEDEVKVYQYLLNKDESTVTSLSKRLQIPRTTIYRICENLADKKFIEWIVYNRGKKVKAVKPEHLGFIVEEKKNQWEETKDALEDIRSLVKISSLDLPITQLRFYKGKEGMKQLIWNTLKAKKEIVGYSIYGRKKIVGFKFIEKYFIEFNKRQLVDKVITNIESYKNAIFALKGLHQQTTDHIRIIDSKDFYVSGDTYIYNNIYAVNFWNENEIIGVEIENEEIVKVQKSIFDELWKRSINLNKIIKRKIRK